MVKNTIVFYTFSPDSKRKSPMIRKSLLLSAMLLLGASLSAKNFDLKSPDGRITVSVDNGKQVTYAVSCDGVPLLVNSALGIELAGTHDLSAQPVRHKASSEDRTLRPVVPFKFSSIRDRYNALRIDFRGGWALEFRAYDDGVAYRILTSGKGTVQVLDETFSIRFPEDYAAVVQQPGSFRTAYEEPYEQVSTSEWSSAERLAVLPALLDTRKGYKILISEAGLEDYPCMFLTGSRENGMKGVFPKVPLLAKEAGDRSMQILREADFIAETTGDRAFPWRYFVIADRDADLIENTMTARLSGPCRLDDTSWIRPGQVSWEFWNAASPYGPDVDFAAGLNTATYKYFIDFAARFGIPYIIMDEGWAKDTRDPFTPNPAVDLRELIRYGRERNVGIILWLTWLTVEKHFDLFERMSQWGIKGVKIDFMDRSDQWMVDYYERVAAEAARHRMLVAFHGAFKPAGLEYRYPNVLHAARSLLREPSQCREHRHTRLPDGALRSLRIGAADAGRQPDALLPRGGVHAIHHRRPGYVGRDPRPACRGREIHRSSQTQGRQMAHRGHIRRERRPGRVVRHPAGLPFAGEGLSHGELRGRGQRLPPGDGLSEKGAAGDSRGDGLHSPRPQRRLGGRDRIAVPRQAPSLPQDGKGPDP